MNDDEVIPESAVRYSFTKVITITGVSRETIVEYCEFGLIPVSVDEVEEADYDDRLINLIQQAETLRNIHGVNLAGIQMILKLSEEVEQLRQELRFRVDG